MLAANHERTIYKRKRSNRWRDKNYYYSDGDYAKHSMFGIESNYTYMVGNIFRLSRLKLITTLGDVYRYII